MVQALLGYSILWAYPPMEEQSGHFSPQDIINNLNLAKTQLILGFLPLDFIQFCDKHHPDKF